MGRTRRRTKLVDFLVHASVFGVAAYATNKATDCCRAISWDSLTYYGKMIGGDSRHFKIQYSTVSLSAVRFSYY